MKAKIIFVSVIMALAIGNADAQVVKREVRQHHRIRQGVRSGELTRSEAKNLRSGGKGYSPGC